DRGGMVYNVKHPKYAAKGDGRVVYDGVIANNATIFTSATAAFTAADVGKVLSVLMGRDGANHSLGYGGKILSLNSATSVNLDTTNVLGAVTGALTTIGSDDTVAIQTAETDFEAAGGGTVYR